MLKFRRFIILSVIAIIAVAGFAFRDNYFEISKNIEIFTSVYKDLNTYYVDEVEASKLMRTGIDAMVNSLDPYTDYISENEIEDYRISVTGQYAGIGAGIVRRGENVVISDPYEGYPAQLADLRAGDILVMADGKEMKGKSQDEVSKMLKGQAGTEIKLVVKRGEETFERTIKRADIKMKNVPFYGMLNNEIGYIVLVEFRSDAGKEVAEALTALKKNPGLKGVILDLRSNPGGFLHEAVNVVNVFIPKNQPVVSTKGKLKELDNEFRTLNNPVDTEIPLVVLVNKSSASASEIVSGTIQDLDRGVIVGQRSFGKGLVQSTRPLVFGSQLKVTTQKYYIPSGHCIQAIDYSKKDINGKGMRIADSMHKSFKTRNGRLVNDGGGVEPDMKTEAKENAAVTKALVNNFIVFDFATKYRNSHEKIADVSSFHLTEEDRNDFLKFVKDKELKYKTLTDKEMEDLKAKAKDEKYFEKISAQFEELKKQLETAKQADITSHKDEIINALEKEILSRYYFEKSQYQSQTNRDADIMKAIELLNNNSAYDGLLK